MTSPTDVRTLSTCAVEYSFLFPLIQELLKFVKKSEVRPIAQKIVVRFYGPRCILIVSRCGFVCGPSTAEWPCIHNDRLRLTTCLPRDEFSAGRGIATPMLSVCLQRWGTVRVDVEHVRMYYRSDTGGRYCIRAGSVYALTRRQHCVKWLHDRHLEIMTSHEKSDSSIDAYLLQEQSCQISSRFYLKRCVDVGCRGGAAVRRRTRDRKVAGSTLWRALSSQLGQRSLPSLRGT